MFLMRLYERIKPKSIQSYLIHMVLALVVIQSLMSWLTVSSLATDVLHQQIGKRALQTAQSVALMPSIRMALMARDPLGSIQKKAEQIRKATGASYVVVGDTDGVRYSHPKPDRIGRHFVGGDTGPALHEGKSYVSRAVGTLGPSLRGMVPIFHDDEIIGFVAVGYLMESVRKAIPAHLNKPLIYIVSMLLIGIVSAIFIAGHLKKITLGLEPAEITALYLERGAVLEAIREGVVSVDRTGEIRLANRAAMHYTGLDAKQLMPGNDIRELMPENGLNHTLETGESEHDVELSINGRDLIFNTVPLIHSGEVQGAVASFRRKDELDRLAFELSRVQEYSELLRVQTHEYSNKLHTIAGLIQIEAHQEALELVVNESTGYEEIIRFLNRAVPHPVIAAIVLGKYNRARELKVELHMDRHGTMVDVPGWIRQEYVVTILGNLLDNAFDAVRHQPRNNRKVELSFTDLGNDLVFEVSDSGPGVSPEQSEEIFRRGVSSKGRERRGLGLFLARKRLREMGGQVMVLESELGGALFTVTIPKTKPEKA
jgi:two-component system CitB family sensor kinase/two-component system sensor histidine kinase DcuS